jgi:hypothetical protein
LGHQHTDIIQLNSPVGLGHQHGTTLTSDTECPNKHRQRQPHTRANKTAKGHRCQARMQSIQQLRLPKVADRRTKRNQIDSPKRKVSTGHRCRAQGTEQLRLPILTLRPASGFCTTFETFWTTKKGDSPHVIVAEPHPLT